MIIFGTPNNDGIDYSNPDMTNSKVIETVKKLEE